VSHLQPKGHDLMWSKSTQLPLFQHSGAARKGVAYEYLSAFIPHP